MAAISLDIGLPYPQHSKPAGPHVSVLRRVQLHPASLTRGRVWIFRRVSVPIVAVKLNHQTEAFRESVYAELSRDKVLGCVLNAYLIEQSVAGTFKTVLFAVGLRGIQFDQHLGATGVGVTAAQGTVGWATDDLLGGRRSEWPPTCLAIEAILSSALPLVRMLNGAEEVIRLSETGRFNVNRSVTYQTCRSAPRFAGRALGSIAWKGAVDAAGRHSPGHNRAARYARDRANFVSESTFHGSSLAHLIARRMDLVFSGAEERRGKLAKQAEDHGPLFGGAA